MLDRAEVHQILGGLSLSGQNVQKLAEDYQRLLQLARKLAEENDRLLAELAEVKSERDEYQTAVHYLSRRETAITVEDIQEMEQSGLGAKDLLDLIAELEGNAQGYTGDRAATMRTIDTEVQS